MQFNDRHIPDSPHVVKFTPPANDAHKVEIAQFPQGVIQPNVPSQFLVRKNGAKGDIEAKVIFGEKNSLSTQMVFTCIVLAPTD